MTSVVTGPFKPHRAARFVVSINRIDCVWVMAPDESKMNMQ